LSSTREATRRSKKPRGRRATSTWTTRRRRSAMCAERTGYHWVFIDYFNDETYLSDEDTDDWDPFTKIHRLRIPPYLGEVVQTTC
jgi:hypothetical protein